MNDDILQNLLSAEEPKIEESQARTFNPKFNVREEFPVWIKEQFPEIGQYARKRKIYPELESRREEIYQAALGAVNHGVTSTNACATARLHQGWKEFERGFGKSGTPKKRARSLERFVEAIKDLSLSLGGNPHYTEAGTFLSGTHYRSGNLKAFVYRDRENNGPDSTYLVFKEKRKIGEETPLVLVGELTRLTREDVDILERTAKTFRGSEIDFIDYIDRMIPEEGTYVHPQYKQTQTNWTGSLEDNRIRLDAWRAARIK